MDRCPVEIYREIFEYACLDDGSTGRSLSLVSRYISETSRPIKLQSVSVIGYKQLLAFDSLLESIPITLRNVRYIFISAHSQRTESDPKALVPEYSQRELAYAAFERILQAISPCVQVLHAFFIFYRPFPLLPLSLPSLVELTLHGPLEGFPEVDERIQFPSLQHLHLASSYSPSYIFGHIAKLTPSLSHLRISALEHSQTFAGELRVNLEDSAQTFPKSLKNIYIHSPTQPQDNWMEMADIYNQTMTDLTKLTQQFKWVTLLPPLPTGMFRSMSIHDAEAAWLESAAGKLWW